MEKTKEILQRKLSQQETEALSRLQSVPAIRAGDNSSFYEHFILTGIKVEQVQPGFISCSFIVPPRLTDSTGKMGNGAIATLVDEVGGALVHQEGLPMNVSVDMSISFLSTAHVNDELEITSRLLGRKGGYSGTIVLLKNKATGESIAEGRHSLFGRHNSKM
ncbi:putative acyl-CoA hydrolase [Medicago truncatula]|uniref:Acyl-coenzyme A thioesterase 13 n=1 Tax=Medicago truncatula TaxID=3880 RepID=G7KE38_MEDTR|nr:acyl-coenzyme A thioesterase 13 [Medicago truncatula]AES98529.1 acyl-CoA thioesterase, putative [Medicago truncatula]AFK44583.1 unknown [Medicago truncatula]RHN56436.1 putative acyl-CoA hydrolase [Medicago truncatula]